MLSLFLLTTPPPVYNTAARLQLLRSSNLPFAMSVNPLPQSLRPCSSGGAEGYGALRVRSLILLGGSFGVEDINGLLSKDSCFPHATCFLPSHHLGFLLCQVLLKLPDSLEFAYLDPVLPWPYPTNSHFALYSSTLSYFIRYVVLRTFHMALRSRFPHSSFLFPPPPFAL